MKYQLLTLLASTLGLVPSMHGAAVTYSSESAFLAALSAVGGNAALESFEAPFPTGPTVDFEGFLAQSGSNLPLSRTTSFASDGTAGLDISLAFQTAFRFRFDSRIQALGFHYQTPANATVAVVTIAQFSSDFWPLPAGTTGFFGFIDVNHTHDFAAIVNNGSTPTTVMVDGVRFGVPEPSVAALCAFAGLLAAGRCQRNDHGRQCGHLPTNEGSTAEGFSSQSARATR